MKYRVVIKKKARKGIRKMPVNVQKRMGFLVDDLKENGPVSDNWPNYSKLPTTEYHCHLSRRWVACWRMEDRTIEIKRCIMQALVKTPRTNISIQGDIPNSVLDVLRREYGGKLKIYEGDDEYIEVTETDWYKEIKTRTTPGDAMRVYRENYNLTQAQLGEKLGNIPRQLISNMERGKRTISLATAKKLAAILNVPASRFLDL